MGVQHNEIADRVDNGNKMLMKGNAAIMMKLRSKETGKEFIVANTHLHWNPKNDFIKYA